MDVWTVSGEVLLNDANQNGFIRIKAASPILDGHGSSLSPHMALHVYVEVDDGDGRKTLDPLLGYEAMEPYRGLTKTLIGRAPGGGIFVLDDASAPAAGGE